MGTPFKALAVLAVANTTTQLQHRQALRPEGWQLASKMRACKALAAALLMLLIPVGKQVHYSTSNQLR